tara:strand:- start:1035 stop:1484 length:450 start_codon:yes stop_codon:yes gene_type:complete
MIEQTLHYHQCLSLIDITKTNVLQHSDSKGKERNQQRNFETVCQLVGLRTQLFDIGRVFKIQDTEIDSFKFGSYYLGEMGFKYNVWTFSFAIEFQDVYRLDNDPYGTIKKDFVNVPAILNLDEQMPTIPHSLFYTSGTYKNIYFMKSIQ